MFHSTVLVRTYYIYTYMHCVNYIIDTRMSIIVILVLIHTVHIYSTFSQAQLSETMSVIEINHDCHMAYVITITVSLILNQQSPVYCVAW